MPRGAGPARELVREVEARLRVVPVPGCRSGTRGAIRLAGPRRSPPGPAPSGSDARRNCRGATVRTPATSSSAASGSSATSRRRPSRRRSAAMDATATSSRTPAVHASSTPHASTGVTAVARTAKGLKSRIGKRTPAVRTSSTPTTPTSEGTRWLAQSPVERCAEERREHGNRRHRVPRCLERDREEEDRDGRDERGHQLPVAHGALATRGTPHHDERPRVEERPGPGAKDEVPGVEAKLAQQTDLVAEAGFAAEALAEHLAHDRHQLLPVQERLVEVPDPAPGAAASTPSRSSRAVDAAPRAPARSRGPPPGPARRRWRASG